jgi:hypothetical protein
MYLQPDRMRVGNLAAFIECVHAVIEFVANLRQLIEPLDDALDCFLHRPIFEFELRQPLDEIGARSCRVKSGKDDCSRRLIGVHQHHEHMDEHAFVVCPAVDQVADQSHDEGTAVCRLMGGGGLDGCKIWLWRQLRHWSVSFHRTTSRRVWRAFPTGCADRLSSDMHQGM